MGQVIRREKVRRHYTVVLGPQVLALDVRGVGLPIVGALVLVGGCAVGVLVGNAYSNCAVSAGKIYAFHSNAAAPRSSMF